MSLRERLARWLLRGVTLEELRVLQLHMGERTITTANNRLTWTTYNAPAAAGAMSVDIADGRPGFFVGGVAAKGAVLPDIQNLRSITLAYEFVWSTGFPSTKFFSPSERDGAVVIPSGEFLVEPVVPVSGDSVLVDLIILPGSGVVLIGGGNIDLVVTKNGVNTSVLINYVGGETGALRSSATIAFNRGDQFGLRAVPHGTITNLILPLQALIHLSTVPPS